MRPPPACAPLMHSPPSCMRPSCMRPTDPPLSHGGVAVGGGDPCFTTISRPILFVLPPSIQLLSASLNHKTPTLPRRPAHSSKICVDAIRVPATPPRCRVARHSVPFMSLQHRQGVLSLAKMSASSPDSMLQFGADLNAARYIDGIRETPNGEVGCPVVLRLWWPSPWPWSWSWRSGMVLLYGKARDR